MLSWGGGKPPPQTPSPSQNNRFRREKQSRRTAAHYPKFSWKLTPCLTKYPVTYYDCHWKFPRPHQPTYPPCMHGWWVSQLTTQRPWPVAVIKHTCLYFIIQRCTTHPIFSTQNISHIWTLRMPKFHQQIDTMNALINSTFCFHCE